MPPSLRSLQFYTSRTNLIAKCIPCRNSTLSPPGHISSPFTSRFLLWLGWVSTRHASSKRWVDRQSRDRFAREAKVQGLKSRAAFKLLQINDRYRLFKPGQTVIDLGYAPGSWSQVGD